MQGDYFSYGLLAALAIALLFAAFTDLRSRQISNKLNAAIALGAPLFWWAGGLSFGEIAWQIGVALASLVILAGFFALRWMGGGDVKLLAALALWVRPALFLELVIAMAIIGGLLTLAFGAWHIARRQRDRLAIPYGVAIAAAALVVIGQTYLPQFQQSGLAG
ncbi:MAG: A24 family peptidase [Novosphingobium sp.]